MNVFRKENRYFMFGGKSQFFFNIKMGTIFCFILFNPDQSKYFIGFHRINKKISKSD